MTDQDESTSPPSVERAPVPVHDLVVPTDKWPKLTHYLFRYPAKFHPPVIRALLETYTEPGDVVLDPFCGSGTLLVEALRLGRNALGIDVDPVAVAVTRAKTHRYGQMHLTSTADAVLKTLAPLRRPADEYQRLSNTPMGRRRYEVAARELSAFIPDIPNLHHWFRKYVIVDLAQIRRVLESTEMPSSHRDLLRVVFASIIRNASNADPVPVSGLEVTRWMLEKEAEGRIVDPFQLFEKAMAKALVAVAEFRAHTTASVTSSVTCGDVTVPQVYRHAPASAVITSPPYHGAVDYYRRHQLEMFWLGLTEDQTRRVELLQHYIGRPHVPPRHRWVTAPLRTALAKEWEDRIREDSDARANEFRHYISGMSSFFDTLSSRVEVGGPTLLVVGHSRWKGSEIPTTQLFEELSGESFELEEVLRYPVKNRYMSYSRHNNADINTEYVLVLRRLATEEAARGCR